MRRVDLALVEVAEGEPVTHRERRRALRQRLLDLEEGLARLVVLGP